MELGLKQLCDAGKDWWNHVLPAYCNPVYAAGLFAAVWLVPGWKTPLEKKIPAPLLLGCCLVIFLGYSLLLTLVHAMSDVTVGKAAKLPAGIAQYSVVIAVFALLSCRQWLRLDALRRMGKTVSLLLVLALLLAGNGNFFPVLWGLALGEPQRYAEAYAKRLDGKAAHPGEVLAVMPLLHAPHGIFPDILAGGVKSWPNKYTAPFYGLKGLEARAPSPAVAFAEAEKRGDLAWRDAGNGAAFAYVPSLALGPNKTYTFDWVFLKVPAGAVPQVRLVVAGAHSPLARLPRSWGAMDRLAAGRWPFRRLFFRPSPLPVAGDNGHCYAIPLPQADSAATGVGRDTWLSVNGGPLVPAMAGEPPARSGR